MDNEILRLIEHRLTEVEQRSKSNTTRLDNHDATLKDNTSLVISIKELASEMKYLRTDLNHTMERLNRLENKDSGTWDKFKWQIVTIILSLLGTVLLNKII